jgi:hypothetical protein
VLVCFSREVSVCAYIKLLIRPLKMQELDTSPRIGLEPIDSAKRERVP